MKAQSRCRHRPANISVIVALMLIPILGMTVLAIDISRLFAIREELVSATHSCALSTMRTVANLDPTTTFPEVQSRASDFAQLFMPYNRVNDQGLGLDPTNICVGTAVLDADSGRYSHFVPMDGATTGYNALYIKSRLSGDDGTALVPILAQVLGTQAFELEAESYVVLPPRNIVLCVDASSSEVNDSWLMQLPTVMNFRDNGYPEARINLQDVWGAFPTEPAGGYAFNGHSNLQPGPVYGLFMETFGYGTSDVDIDRDYRPRQYASPHGDSGLLYLPEDVTWDLTSGDPDVVAQYPLLHSVLTLQGYSSSADTPDDEVSAIMTPQGTSDSWKRHVRVALGLTGWRSGKAGGRWLREGWAAGNGDDIIDFFEEVDLGIPQPMGDLTWNRYLLDVKTMDFSNGGADPYADFSYCFGVKTLMHTLVRRGAHSDPGLYPALHAGLALTPIQPYHSSRVSIDSFMQALGAFGNNDRVGLIRYSTASSVVMGLQSTENLLNINTALDEDVIVNGETNFAAALAEAASMLTSQQAVCNELEYPQYCSSSQAPIRHGERMIIMLTDGLPTHPLAEGTTPAEAALEAAQAAAEEGISIHVLSAGLSSADQVLTQTIADIGGGIQANAAGHYIAFQEQMTEFFNEQLVPLRTRPILVGDHLTMFGNCN